MNRITEVKLTLVEDRWRIEVTKEFAPEYGGGSQVFKAAGGAGIERALELAKGAVVATPVHNTRKYLVLNETDGVYATPEPLPWFEALQFIIKFRERFQKQGYYASVNGHIPVEDLKLTPVPEEEA